MLAYAREVKNADPGASVDRPRGVGLARHEALAATTSSTAARTAGGLVSLPIAPATADGLSALAAAADPAAERARRQAAARRLHRRTTTRRAASSATTSRPRCSRGATGRRGRCGIRPTSTRPGSTIGRPLHPAAARLGRTSTTRARRSASPNTTGAPKATSTAPRRRPTSSASSAAKAWTWPRAGRRPPRASPTYKAMKIYRNYDGNKSTFGDVSVKTTSSSNPDSLSVFGAQRTADDALTVMVVNKALSGAASATITLANVTPRHHRPGLAAHVGQRHHAARRRRGQRQPHAVGDPSGPERHPLRHPPRHDGSDPAPRPQRPPRRRPVAHRHHPGMVNFNHPGMVRLR